MTLFPHSRFIGAVLAVVGLICAPAVAFAQSSSDLAGAWAWKIDGRTVAVLRLNDDPATGGTIERPSALSLMAGAGGVRISNVQMPVVHQSLEPVGASGDGFRYRYVDPNDPARVSDYAVRARSGGTAELTLVGAGLAPLPLRRAGPEDAVATDWEPGKIYRDAMVPADDNAALHALFEADQAVRQTNDIDWSVVAPQDVERRRRVAAMLEAGDVRTANDYERAAFILQHGDAPDDYLLAHALAGAAVVLGKTDAAWISAATLDRYLQRIGQPQIYGTQFLGDFKTGAMSQGDYDRDLISDSLRSVMGVPPLEGQAEQLRSMQDEGGVSTPAP